jgi:xylan 1,4-beta-xylosidase
VVDGNVQTGIDAQLRALDSGFAIVASFPELRDKPIIIGESDPDGCAACSSTIYPQNGYRNGTLFASYTAAAMAHHYTLAEKHRVNLLGAVTWAFEFEDQPYFAGFRALSTNGIALPVLNTFRMLGKMEGGWIQATSDAAVPIETMLKEGVREAPDVNAIASLAPGRMSVFVWHHHDRDVPGPVAEIEIAIGGLRRRNGTARLQHYRIDQEHSNSFTAWKRMGSPQRPSPRQIAALERAGELATIAGDRSVRIRDGKLGIRLSLPRQGVSLLVVEWGR